jgi:hypothetical protein
MVGRTRDQLLELLAENVDGSGESSQPLETTPLAVVVRQAHDPHAHREKSIDEGHGDVCRASGDHRNPSRPALTGSDELCELLAFPHDRNAATSAAKLLTHLGEVRAHDDDGKSHRVRPDGFQTTEILALLACAASN